MIVLRAAPTAMENGLHSGCTSPWCIFPHVIPGPCLPFDEPKSVPPELSRLLSTLAIDDNSAWILPLLLGEAPTGVSQVEYNQVGRESSDTPLAQLVVEVYAELRTIATAYLRRERPGHTLQTTALVHEAYLRLARRRGWNVDDRAGFCAAAAQAIRRILTDHARRRLRQKHGGARVQLQLGANSLRAPQVPVDVLELDEALARLANQAPRPARIVELRYFGGLSELEVAQVLRVSRRTVQCDWRWARAWLARELG